MMYRDQRLILLTLLLLCQLLRSAPARAQFQPDASQDLNPISLINFQQASNLANARQIAQQLPSTIPTDVTPIPLGQEQDLLRPGKTFYLLQKLPSRLFFNTSIEASNRVETNVFFTASNPRPDYVFRILPNTTLGWQFAPNTGIYCNYFVLKDVFADHGTLSNPTTQSVSLGLRYQRSFRLKTNVQFDMQARELWQVHGVHQFDYLPGLTVTHVFTPNTIAFTNLQLQMRGGEWSVAPTREIDPFYTAGVLYKRGGWIFSAVDTYVTNFRNHNAIPPQGNVSMIAQFEAARVINRKIPGLMLFARAEPIWNWRSHGVPGLSGFDFRFFGGIRYSANRNSLSESMMKLRKQLQESSAPQAPPVPNSQSLQNSFPSRQSI